MGPLCLIGRCVGADRHRVGFYAEEKIASALNKEFAELMHELLPSDPVVPDERTRIEVDRAA
jgi:hypothetical protein